MFSKKEVSGYKQIATVIGIFLLLWMLTPAAYAASFSGGDYSFDYTSSYSYQAYSSWRGVAEKGAATPAQGSDGKITYTVTSCKDSGPLYVAGSGTGTLTITNKTDCKCASFWQCGQK